MPSMATAAAGLEEDELRNANQASASGALPACYPQHVDVIRDEEYPQLRDTTYLDHGGTTPYAQSLVSLFAQQMTSNLFGNPHSESASSQLSTRRIDDARLRALRFFNADPDHFDLVFVANATAAIKLVADALRDYDPRGDGFWYGYHVDSHTSLAGVRELAARGSRCFVRKDEVDEWMAGLRTTAFGSDGGGGGGPTLFAYPAQSNMTGRRLPLSWCGNLRHHAERAERRDVFSLLDAASLVSTSPLDLSDQANAPDFTALSFYKIFGFPDLGALIVRKPAGHVFERRKYFGGGTVGMVSNFGQGWHARKEESIHDHVEDGTLPFHDIIALNCAIDVHERLYGDMENISLHTTALVKVLYNRLITLKHANGRPLCEIYMASSPAPRYGDARTQGPIISFNLKDRDGNWVGKSDVDKLAAIKNVQIRSGGLCNPGGTAYHLDLTDIEMRRNYTKGVRCGNETDVVGGKPTGQLRVSLGAMTNLADIERFVGFIEEFYVDKGSTVDSGGEINSALEPSQFPEESVTSGPSRFVIDRLCVYPIKSCRAFVVPDGEAWQVKPEGLAWDREWCLIHQGTGLALNQKRYPRMALIHPFVDLDRGVLRIARYRPECGQEKSSWLEVPLSRDDELGPSATTPTALCQNSVQKSSTVCGDRVIVHVYSSSAIAEFFSSFLEVPCTLARFPAQTSARYSKAWDVPSTQQQQPHRLQHKSSGEVEGSSSLDNMPGSFPNPDPCPIVSPQIQTHLLLSNESPMLLISRSSVNKLNEVIKSSSNSFSPTSPPNSAVRARRKSTPKAVPADVFRANIVVAEEPSLSTSPSQTSPTPTPCPSREHPYVEDTWSALQIGPRQHRLAVLGPCQRCQMVCVDQRTGERGEEPFATLSKMRKSDGKVFFGRHVCLDLQTGEAEEDGNEGVWVRVGDAVGPVYE